MKSNSTKPSIAGTFRAILFLLLMISCGELFSQATISMPVGIGSPCGTPNVTTDDSLKVFTYNSTTNGLGPFSRCRPTFTAPGFGVFSASIAFNPGDQMYYMTRSIRQSNGTYNSFIWRWAADNAICPTTSLFRQFNNTYIAGIEFDQQGRAFQINFTGSAAPYGLELQTIDLATGVEGPAKVITLPAGVNINSMNGDMVITPEGQFLFIFDNKYFVLNYEDYFTSNPLVATFISNVNFGSNQTLVGLTYADGKLLGSTLNTSNFSACQYHEIDILSGAREAPNYLMSGTVFSSFDLTSVTTAIGVSKELVSATPTGVAGQYDLVYHIRIQNMGDVPIRNLQANDNLASINPALGAAAVSNVSISSVYNPLNLTLNTSYNGTTNTNMLSGTQTLPNIPLANNYLVIRLAVRLSGIVPGNIYSNSATANGTGFRGVAVTDQSTNGPNPDQNSDNKADSPGENTPTPFTVSVVAETPPCEALNTILYNQDFGTGTGMSATMPGTSTTDYTRVSSGTVGVDQATISNNAANANASNWLNMPDRSGTGRMLLVNADASPRRVFADELNVSCGGLKYSFFGYISFIGNSSYQTLCNGFGGFRYPKLTVMVRDANTNQIIASVTTGQFTSSSWTQFGMKWVMPNNVTRVRLEIYNAGEGGCGNDFALDDLQFGLCDPTPTVSTLPSGGCIGGSTTLGAVLTDTVGMSSSLEYQWQSSTDNVNWTNISGATSTSYSITNMNASHSRYYRLIAASIGNINNTSCRYVSNSFFLNLKNPSTAPTAALKNKIRVCVGEPVQLTAQGGTLGTNAVYRWYRGSCGGTLVGTGQTITVNPISTTTYFVRIEGDCNTTACASVTVTVSCDIDDDDDGITDLAENNGLDADLDTDGDGLPDFRDPGSPGFTDANSDGIDDRYDSDRDGIINSLDLDSDNDGIPDVVEAYGVDANGDGRIDNYSDTDSDGLSQNVDANTSGVTGSGTGLGLQDLDGDGVPNQFDLDSDNDGIPDIIEAGGTDANNDGRVDGFADADQDGFANAVDGDANNDNNAENSSNALARTGADNNNDGRADSYPFDNMDNDRRMNAYDLDSDGDGITDVREAGFTDSNNDGRIDGALNPTGWNAAVDALASLTLRNTDGRGPVDYLDIDADDDGIPDNVEAMATNSYQLPSYLDADNDGIDDRYDSISGFGGNGITPNDQDGDLRPDYLDEDSDNDTALDIYEGNDFNNNGRLDDNVQLTGNDTDGDGLDNRFDRDNSSARGTSAFMGNGGSLSGDPDPGSMTMVQRTESYYLDRDWRFQPYILPVKYLGLAASLTSNGVKVSWKATSSEPVEEFVIERSIDGAAYVQVGQIKLGNLVLNDVAYQFLDPLRNVNGAVAQYRVKALVAGGKQEYSNPATVRLQMDWSINISPNPTSDHLVVRVVVKEPQSMQVMLIDGMGRVVKNHFASALRGMNSVQLNDLGSLPKGTYTVRIVLNNQQATTQQVIIR
ncbi:T9SS type A sorting domain-containing protein [Flavihumibacter rivuli]|uniref:Ig-like domain-containing protein n=1 Tax=Flavihumibacter rivuli TaxID=2838156 RepID=UPI001BDE76A6|nr:T9SS type A sorting domain-containing protein [Flavihumibacter rivuli]ULQ56375.1 T9SS type A sorting domain-containing protein [Flavihumibacter rivuli]